MNKIILIGKYVYYTIFNVRMENNKLLWDESKFYSQLGNLEDKKGKYFIIPAPPDGEVDLSRNQSISKKIIIRYTALNGLEIHEILEGTIIDLSILESDIDGDILIEVFLPSIESGEEIVIYYKEVI